MAKRVLVCGGRDYHNESQMILTLSAFLLPDDVIVHGGARGADSLAGDVGGRLLGHKVEVYPADWHTHGKAAGPIRNQQMLDSGIDLVIAFPGGKGTEDIVRRARKTGVEVVVEVVEV